MNRSSSVIFFAVISFFIAFADAIMSYISPIFIESQVRNTMTMGLIFSFSSIIGIVCDLIFPKLFFNQPHFFFLKATLLSAVIFPLTYLLFPQHIITLLLAMAVWGIYYELSIFSSFQFIRTYVHISEHAKTWGLLYAFQASAYAIAPFLAENFLSENYKKTFIFVWILLGIAIILSLIFKRMFVKKVAVFHEVQLQQRTWLKEIKIWKLLFPKVWHLLLLQLLVFIVDSTYWTIGTLLMVQLSHEHFLGSLFLTAHIAPTIILGFILGQKAGKDGKKRIAVINSLITGLSLSSYMFIESTPILLLVTVISSISNGIAMPEIKAVFENYVSRLKDNDNEMIGMQSSSTSLAYIIGPILATGLASFFDYKTAFSIIGLVLATVAVSLLFIVPAKVKLPQKELSKI